MLSSSSATIMYGSDYSEQISFFIEELRARNISLVLSYRKGEISGLRVITNHGCFEGRNAIRHLEASLQHDRDIGLFL